MKALFFRFCYFCKSFHNVCLKANNSRAARCNSRRLCRQFTNTSGVQFTISGFARPTAHGGKICKASFACKSPNMWAPPTPDRAARPVPRKGMIPLTSNLSTTFA